MGPQDDRVSDRLSERGSEGVVLQVVQYRGATRSLTRHEVALAEYFERRDEEHRRQVRRKRERVSEGASDFMQVSG
jgi:hypothetical protein